MKCSYCENNSIYHRKHSGENLCGNCFNKSIEHQIYKTISKFKMLKPQDKIILGLSGGKDSMVLLCNLITIQKKIPNSPSIIALTINEGISEYREKCIIKSKEYCKINKVEHKIISFKEKLGKSMEEILEIYKNNYGEIYPCNICATIRRRLLNDEGKKLGGTVLVLGHNLDDVSQTFLMNFLRKDFNKISRMNPFLEENNIIYMKKEKPLMKIPEKEILLYAQNKGLNFVNVPCPYKIKYPILRKRVQSFLNNCEEYSPEIKFNLFKGFIELSDILWGYNQQLKDKESDFNTCKICNQPCGKNREICLFCEIKENIAPY